MSDFSHTPVLFEEILLGLAPQPGGLYLDATLGRAGHTRGILTSQSTARVVTIDRDGGAIELAQQVLEGFGPRVQFWQGNFADFAPGPLRFDGVIADLGVSSPQLDDPLRGFSFRQTSPLDMRMDQTQELTAATVVNTWDQQALAAAFFTYGEERFSRRIARQIVQRRPLQTTTDLVQVVQSAVPGGHQRIHPATRVFQALRIVVNQELAALETFLARAPHWLKPGGKLGVISFHSLEDRIVKHRFRDSPLLEVLTRKPITPQAAELQANPRSRSAKLRWALRSAAAVQQGSEIERG